MKGVVFGGIIIVGLVFGVVVIGVDCFVVERVGLGLGGKEVIKKGCLLVEVVGVCVGGVLGVVMLGIGGVELIFEIGEVGVRKFFLFLRMLLESLL